MKRNNEYLDTSDIVEYLRLYLKNTRGKKFELLSGKCLKFFFENFETTYDHYPHIDGFILSSDLSLLKKITNIDLEGFTNAVFTMKTAHDKKRLMNQLRDNIKDSASKLNEKLTTDKYVWCMVINIVLNPSDEKQILNYAMNNGFKKSMIINMNTILYRLVENREQAIELADSMQILLPDKKYKYHDLIVSLAAKSIMLKLNEIWNEKYYFRDYRDDLHEVEEFFKARYLLAKKYLEQDTKQEEQDDENEEFSLIIDNYFIERERNLKALDLSLKIPEVEKVYEYFFSNKNGSEDIDYLETEQNPNTIDEIGMLTISADFKIKMKDLSVLLEFYIFTKVNLIFYEIKIQRKSKDMDIEENKIHTFIPRVSFNEHFKSYLLTKYRRHSLDTTVRSQIRIELKRLFNI